MRFTRQVGWCLWALSWSMGSLGQSPQAEPPRVKEVILVFKTHFDIGYTHLAREVVDSYRATMIDRALAVCDDSQSLPADQRFVWTIPGWPMTQILWPGQSSQRQARLEQAVRDGRLVWHAMAGSTHTESLELEDMVRSLGFSSCLARRFGQALPRDAKLTDVPTHVWLLPTLLRHAGVDFLHVGCNRASTAAEVPRLFWWEGPDGSRLLTMYAADGYGGKLTPPDDWPHRTWLALIHSGDNAGPPTSEAVRKLLAEAAQKLPGVKVRMGRLSDFAAAILAERAEIPVVRADMPDTWIHGLMSMPIETGIARRCRPRLAAWESLHTQLCLRGVESSSVAGAIAGAYEQSWLYGEHTWGASCRYYGPRLFGQAWQDSLAQGKYAFAEESWREHGQYARNLQDAVAAGAGRDLQLLGRAVNVTGQRIVVYNPLPWPRSDVVSLAVEPGTRASWKDAEGGRAVPAVLEGKTLRFLAHDVPAMGYRTYVPDPRAPQTGVGHGRFDAELDPKLSSPAFQVTLDTRRGGIVSLVDRRAERELVDQASTYVLGQYLYERFSDAQQQHYSETYCKPIATYKYQFGKVGMPADTPYVAASPAEFRLRRFRDPLGARAELSAQVTETVPHAVTLSVCLYDDLPYADLTWTVAGKKADPRAEAGWLCLPLAIGEPQFRLGRLGSIVDPSRDMVPGTNRDLFCIHTGLTVADQGGRGVGICPLDSPLVSLGEPGIYHFTQQFTPRRSTVFVQLFNNAWSTNFQQWIAGDWSSTVRIWATAGKNSRDDLIGPGCEARWPCQAALVDGAAGRLAATGQGIALAKRGTLVTALGPNPDGAGIVLRLWELAGDEGGCEVQVPSWLAKSRVQPCDLRGQPHGTPLEVRQGRLTIPVRRFAPASLILTPEP